MEEILEIRDGCKSPSELIKSKAFNRYLGKWVRKAHSERYNGTKVCLFPVRANTKWWAEVCVDSEIRFINGEVNFNDEPRGLWAAMCIMIFGEQAKIGKFSVIDYSGKEIVDKDEARDSDKLRALEMLMKIAGMFPKEKRTESLAVFEGFSKEKLAQFGGASVKLISHGEKDPA